MLVAKQSHQCRRLLQPARILLATWLLSSSARAADSLPDVSFELAPGVVAISIDGESFATFVYEDDKITRPYFSNVKAPGGAQVTRRHPPIDGQDVPDHAALHPGIWMSFGDISGNDYWRLAAPVEFEMFVEESKGGRGSGSFVARFGYHRQGQPDEIVCHEDLRCAIQVVPNGRLLLWDSTFFGDKEFHFGDQEEMGLGVRVATAIRAQKKSDIGLPPGDGEIISSRGDRNEKDIWGKTADWCDYSGEVGDQRVGIAIFCHPKNFRPSWFHARDYGLLVANPFGRAAFGKGEPSQLVIKPGEQLRLRYGVLIHSDPPAARADIAGAYADYVRLTND